MDEEDLRPEKEGMVREERETRSEEGLEPWWEMARARRAWERVSEEEEAIFGLWLVSFGLTTEKKKESGRTDKRRVSVLRKEKYCLRVGSRSYCCSFSKA